jgi:hypothetical protein
MAAIDGSGAIDHSAGGHYHHDGHHMGVTVAAARWGHEGAVIVPPTALDISFGLREPTN